LTDPAAEPAKSAYRLEWPTDVDESDPPLDHPELPLNLSTILRDLADMRLRTVEAGGELVLSSFFWLVYDGMRLDPVRDRILADYLNVTFAPYRYRDMERFADFQNRTFRKFAASNNIPFLEIAAMMPRDPALFSDAIHATYGGVRLHAWIVAQQLATMLAQRLAEHRLPRPARTQLSQHPAFVGGERTVLATCNTSEKPPRMVITPYAEGLKVPSP
jgi:hypothetical protein